VPCRQLDFKKEISMANPKETTTVAQESHKHDPSHQVVEVLLDVLRRVDREAKQAAELSPEAQAAVESYEEIAAALAVREFSEDKADLPARHKGRTGTYTRHQENA
jgi:hypothetical protein